ncbi:MAG: Adenine DNA glycosylase [Holosporales bacterium]
MEDELLKWYDAHQRDLPWRAKKGEMPNPYFVYLSEIFLQQTTVQTVIDYFNRFVKKWPTLQSLAQADLDDILKEFQGLGYYSRARNLEKCTKAFVADGGIPMGYKNLLKYPGIGDYTAKAIGSIAFNEPVIPIDGNVTRVFSRYFGLSTALPGLKKDVLLKTQMLSFFKNPHDFSQSLMDLGAMICKPSNPLCEMCPLKDGCFANKNGLQSFLPIAAKKNTKPKRHGTAFIIQTKDALVLEKNETDSLLKNLWGVPTSPWIEVPSLITEKNAIKHIFTHFTLQLNIEHINVESISDFKLKGNQIFVLKEDIKKYPISTLMKKVLKAACIE